MASSAREAPVELKNLSIATVTDLAAPAPVVPAPLSTPPSPSYQSDNENGTDEHERQMASLPPVDTGKDAWLFLAACFVLEALIWGFPFAFGIFQEYYVTHEPFKGASSLAVVGTVAMGVMYLDVPLIMGMLRLFPQQGRWSPMAGLLIMCLSLSLSSFSSTVPQLIATQGVLYGIGGSICYSPCIVYMDEWFVRRKGLAYGIMWSGTGIAGVVLPLLVEHLLGRYGWQTTLRVFSVIIFVASAPLAYFIKPRLPPSNATQAKPWRLSFLLTRTFILYQLANVAEAMGFFLPGIYLPLFARSALGAGSLPSALTILFLNIASVFGCIGMGGLIDRLHVTTCLLVSTVGATLGIFFLWGFASNIAMLYVFCIVYGFFAGSFTSAWPGIMREMSKVRVDGRGGGGTLNTVDTGMVFAFLAAGRGVGNVVSGPLSELLVKTDSWQGYAQSGYGSGFGSLIVFTGATALAGGGSFLCRRIGWL